MNQFRNTNLHAAAPPPYSASGPVPSPPVIHTGHSSVTVWSRAPQPHQVPSDQGGGPHLPASGAAFSLGSRTQSGPAPVSASALSPYPTPTSCQVSVIIPPPDLRSSPLPSPCCEDTCPDLECSVCFSQFNNVFRCPKMLQCKHTFCLECLARINVKSAEPNAIQCPLCRGLTPLPALGLPKLATDSDVLSYLPAAMQRVYSVRFVRSKGKLQVKRSTEGQRRWGQRSLTSLRSVNRSLDVGLPSPPPGSGGEPGGVSGVLFRLTDRPACRAFLLTSVVVMMLLLMGVIIFLLTFGEELN